MFRHAIIIYLTIELLTEGKAQGQWLKARAEKGIGAYGLLRKYQLLDLSGNLKAFYDINRITEGSSLQKDQTYLLPVKVVRFDGQSIKSSLGLKDNGKVKDIQTYNEALVSAGVKSRSYRQDKNLWVPQSMLDAGETGAVVKTTTLPSRKENQPPSSSRYRELVADARLSDDLVLEEQDRRGMENSGKKAMVKKVASKTLTVGLFGPGSASVPVESDELADQVFYIVPGHGGPDPGAMFKDNASDFTFCEDEYAYDVSLRLARNLLTKGATVYMIVQDKNDGIRDERYLECDNDEVCIGDHDMPVSQIKRLRQGMIKTNTPYFQNQMEGVKKQWMISIHIDSQPEENRQDVFFYYQAESKASRKKARELRNVFAEKYKKFQGRDYNGTISARPLYVVRTSQADPVFVELANIRNADDRERIASPRNRQLLADWMLEGFLP